MNLINWQIQIFIMKKITKTIPKIIQKSNESEINNLEGNFYSN